MKTTIEKWINHFKASFEEIENQDLDKAELTDKCYALLDEVYNDESTEKIIALELFLNDKVNSTEGEKHSILCNIQIELDMFIDTFDEKDFAEYEELVNLMADGN